MKIVNSNFITSASQFKQLEKSDLPEIVFIGRSNVGKSSLINVLLNRKNLAQISKKPGKTRTINLFNVEYIKPEGERKSLIFADLPGYGYAKVSNSEKVSWKKLIETYLQKRENLCGIVLIVDIRQTANAKDIQAVRWINSFQKPFLIAATKSDKLSKSEIVQQLKLLKQDFPDLVEEEIIEFSAKNSRGKEKVINWIDLNLINTAH